MGTLRVDPARCDLCGNCVERCPFDALHLENGQVAVNEKCRMCSACIRACPHQALRIERPVRTVDKNQWRDILVYAEQENGDLHPVTYELIGEARRLAVRVDYRVKCVMTGGKGTRENAEKLLPYGVSEVFVYEHPGFDGFRADCYCNAVADCIRCMQPSCVLIGATACGRSLAPRLSTRFRTGLTADCTELQMRENTDLVQIRPAFGGNIMAQIVITDSRPQFATVRYKVMDRAEKVDHPDGTITLCEVPDEMVRSGISLLERAAITRTKSIEEEDVLVVAGRGVRSEAGVEMVRELAALLGGQLCFTRPMVEAGFGDSAHQIGLSGRTVKPRLIITCGVSGAVQFTSCMNAAQTIVAVNTDPDARIFQVAHYRIVDDLYQIVPDLITRIQSAKEAG